jgi:RNA polymerase sigma-70 factor (ECF subfamily)
MLRPLTEAEAARAAEVFDRHQSFVASVARRYSPTPQDVPDIVQAVGVQVCRALSGFRSDSQITTWLYSVTRNAAMDLRRRERAHSRRVQGLLERPLPDAVVDPDELVYRGEQLAALHGAIDQLRPKQQEAIRCVLDERNVSVVRKSTRQRAMRALRQMLADRDGGGE